MEGARVEQGISTDNGPNVPGSHLEDFLSFQSSCLGCTCPADICNMLCRFFPTQTNTHFRHPSYGYKRLLDKNE